MVLEKSLESPLDCKEIKLVHPTGNQPRIFFRRTDAEAEALILWPPDSIGIDWNSLDSLEKTLMLGKIEAGRRRGQQRMRWLDSITNLKDMNLSKLYSGGSGRYWRTEMAPHSSTVARKIPWMEEPGRLQSMGSHRVGHD